MTHRRYDPSTDDRVVKHLFQCLLSDEQIAERLNVAPGAIAPARARLNLGRAKGRQPTTPREDDSRPSLDLSTPMAVAFQTFGGRLKEANGAYRLDGTPIRFFDLMKRVNRERKSNGQEQVGHERFRV